MNRLATDARINIDPKSNGAVEALAATIRSLGVEDRVCVTAFSRRRTREVKRLVGPALCTGGGAKAAPGAGTSGSAGNTAHLVSGYVTETTAPAVRRPLSTR